MLTAGATHGLHFVATTLLGSDAVVFIEDPTYFLAITMLRDDFGMKVVPGRSIFIVTLSTCPRAKDCKVDSCHRDSF